MHGMHAWCREAASRRGACGVQESRLPERLAARAAKVAEGARAAAGGATAQRPQPATLFGAPAAAGAAPPLHITWLRQLSEGAAPDAFRRMHAELAQLNALYARALAQAAALMHARRVDAVGDGFTAALEAVEASAVGETLVAMDAINGLELSTCVISRCIQQHIPFPCQATAANQSFDCDAWQCAPCLPVAAPVPGQRVHAQHAC
jgi:hypothetical protein